jgi:hypothetical protein
MYSGESVSLSLWAGQGRRDKTATAADNGPQAAQHAGRSPISPPVYIVKYIARAGIISWKKAYNIMIRRPRSWSRNTSVCPAARV